jgi:hypothetical protein
MPSSAAICSRSSTIAMTGDPCWLAIALRARRGASVRPGSLLTLRWSGMDSNVQFRAGDGFGFNLPDAHRSALSLTPRLRVPCLPITIPAVRP